MKVFRVIEIIDEFSVIINYGKVHGACSDDIVRVISTGSEVIDPETYEVLGTLDLVKANLTIVTVYEKFSLCKRIVSHMTTALISPIEQFKVRSNEIKKLNVDIEQATNRQLPTDMTIRVGDKVEI